LQRAVEVDALRRCHRFNADLSGLPPFLVRDGGVNSGFMIAQVTAAALASENKVTAGDHVAAVAEDQRVVRSGVGFNLQHARGVAAAWRCCSTPASPACRPSWCATAV
jgi:hypothetical protein